MDDLTVAQHQGLARDFVLHVELQLTLARQVLEEGRDIVRIHLAGVVRHGRR